MARTVLVTGGAKRVGAAIVRVLAERGHAVVIHHHESRDEADALIRDIMGRGGRAAAVSADLADRDATVGLIGEAVKAIGCPIDGLVNSASQFEFDRPPIADLVLLGRLTEVNLGAPVLLASALAAQDDVEDGAIVNILDQKVANLNPDFFSYTCSKLALAGATEMLALAFAPRIRVNAVSPGLTLPSGDQSEAEFAAVARENLLRRPVEIEQIGRAVEFLLTCPSVTGQNLFIDNGQRFLKRDSDVMFERARG